MAKLPKALTMAQPFWDHRSMLLSLLPGLRDVRTPLAAGLIYLLTAWLFLAPGIPKRDQATGVIKSLYDLSEICGKPASLATVAFCAYLIGSLAGAAIEKITLFATLIVRKSYMPSLSQEAEADLISFLISELVGVPFREVRFSGRGNNSSPYNIVAMTISIGDRRSEMGLAYTHLETGLGFERSQLRIKLLITKPEIYGEYDRYTAEADFRLGVAVAGIGLISAWAIMGSAWWWLALACPILLVPAALMKSRQANDLLIQTIVAGELSSSTLDAVVRKWRTDHGEETNMPATDGDAAPDADSPPGQMSAPV
ncbi:hypothetical protein [Streptomyces sp. NPDC005303]|uniref:hypothetical protein n=1 Tax=Streptomyces sp. NPDC005303 TaxID=3155713 RepID=UPI0033B5DCD6